MNFSSHSPNCSQFASSDVSDLEWRPNVLTSEMSVVLISLTIVNLLVSPLTIFLNVLVILAVKTTPQLRDKYNVLLACLAGSDIMTGALGQPVFIAELIYRLTGSPASEFCIIPHAARLFIRTSLISALQYLAMISIERYISIIFPFKYHDIVTKRRLIVSVILVWLLVFPSIFFSIYNLDLLNSFFYGFVIFLAIFILIFCRIASYHEARARIAGKITTPSAKAKVLKEKKALKTTSFVIGVVLSCYIPMTLFRIVSRSHKISPDAFLATESFTVTLVLCNSVFNPLIYCARSREYRRAFKKLLHRTNYVQPL